MHKRLFGWLQVGPEDGEKCPQRQHSLSYKNETRNYHDRDNVGTRLRLEFDHSSREFPRRVENSKGALRGSRGRAQFLAMAKAALVSNPYLKSNFESAESF